MVKEIVVESLSSPGCHSCEIFEAFWHSVESQYPNVKYRNVSIVTPEGIEMASRYSIFASPGIIVNGELFSTGGVNQDQFIKKLQELNV